MADMRRCIGSAKFGIAAHDAPVGDFPVQPSQKDGLGRMCKPHWTEYTRALRKAALARTAATTKPVSAKPASRPVPKPAKKWSRRRKPADESTVQAADAPIAPGRLSKTEGEQIMAAANAARANEEATTA